VKIVLQSIKSFCGGRDKPKAQLRRVLEINHDRLYTIGGSVLLLHLPFPQLCSPQFRHHTHSAHATQVYLLLPAARLISHSAMNAHRPGADILSSRPIHQYASQSSHDETPLIAWRNHQELAYTIIALFCTYLLLDHFGLVPVSLIQLLWNGFVYLTPSWVLVALDSRMSPSDSSPSSPSGLSFHAKSESMQRILGLDNNSFPFFPRPRSLSGIGSALLGNNKDAIPSGLGNWDNSCYQNSIIQGLASLKSLSAFLGRNVHLLGEKSSFSTHQALKDIIDLLNSASNHGHKLWIPSSLKSMSSWQQQDAQEYFSKLVDQIDIEIQRASRGNTRNMGLKMAGPEENILKEICVDTSAVDENVLSTIEKAAFRNPLEGLLAQRVGCMKCGWTEGLSLIPFNCLTVPLGPKYEYDIRECLDQYMTLEPIEGVECAKCTLLRARDQLKSLLGSISEEDEADNLQSPGLSDAVKTSAQTRLEAVQTALEEDDFAEKTLANKCHIPSKNRMTTTKSRQAVIARAPQCLIVHINRSLFDEVTGMLKKNYAAVKFPKNLDLNDWCLGTLPTSESEGTPERWVTDPSESMLPRPSEAIRMPSRQYELRAVITHYGRHENGHYICYRKYPTSVFPAPVPDEVLQAEGDKEKPERWYRLSDDDVQMVSEGHVMSQGGAFMLFYEAVDTHTSGPLDGTAKPESVLSEISESVSNFTMSENMSTTSTVTDAESTTSRATSVSTPDRTALPAEGLCPDSMVSKSFNEVNNDIHISTEELGSPSAITT
jgi:ubiquitin carboxyl-terminal hydrolase 1